MSARTNSSSGPPAPGGDTRTRLLSATLLVLREAGLAGTSARTIAARAEANQGLIFYHFHSVSELIEAASNRAVEEAVQHYRAAFDEVTSLRELLDVGRALHRRERERGNVAVMAQILSGAQHDPILGRAARSAIGVWTREVRAVLERVLATGPARGLLDVDGLAHLITAGFIGIELYDAADHVGADRALTTLEALGRIVETLDSAPPITRRALRAAVRHPPQDGS